MREIPSRRPASGFDGFSIGSPAVASSRATTWGVAMTVIRSQDRVAALSSQQSPVSRIQQNVHVVATLPAFATRWELGRRCV